MNVSILELDVGLGLKQTKTSKNYTVFLTCKALLPVTTYVTRPLSSYFLHNDS